MRVPAVGRRSGRATPEIHATLTPPRGRRRTASSAGATEHGPHDPTVPSDLRAEENPQKEPPPIRPAAVAAAPPQGVAFRREDRKSTRLNSSHANISYAVFCLKKKTSKS